MLDFGCVSMVARGQLLLK